jgi:hypothetical protein
MEAKPPIVKDTMFPIHHHQPGEPALNPVARAQIGRRLRVIFDGQAAPVPERVQDLLAQIEQALGPAGGSR